MAVSSIFSGKKINQSLLILRKCSTDTLPFPEKLDNWWYCKSKLLITLVGGCSKLLIGFGNNLKIYNNEVLTKLLDERANKTPLLTASNHMSMFDDPGLMSNLVSFKFLSQSRKMRWSLAAKEICFATPFTSSISSHGKVIPIVRGEGIYQSAVNYALNKLNEGEWVHIFPEGKIAFEPVRLKWGVGRLIAECKKQPIVLPFWHCGMDDFLPCKTPYIPKLRKKITVLFGEPITYQHILDKYHSRGVTSSHGSEVDLRRELTDLVQDALAKLKIEAELLHVSR